MTAPTTRETADHIGEANEKVADHIGDATTMIDHAELARLAEAATLGKWQNGIDDCVVALAEHTGNVICLPPTDDMQASLEFWPRNAAFIAAANPATVLALLSEIAALRGAKWDVQHADTMNDMVLMGMARDEALTRLTQAERQRDEAVGLLTDWAGYGDFLGQKGSLPEKTRAFLANQGADQ